jgi:hypothetical protein
MGTNELTCANTQKELPMSAELPHRIEFLQGRIAVDPWELLGRSRASDKDVVVLSGTLLEGFGNLYSDLDLYVIGDELPTKTSEVPATLVIREDGCVRRVNETLESSANILLDVQYYTFRELDTLARSLRVLYQEARQSTQIYRKTLHHEDEDLIHKLLTGKVLQDDSGKFNAAQTFDHGMFCFLKYRNEVGGYSEFRDLVGSWTAGDLDTCIYNTRGYLISQVSGMMFLSGNTNPRPKWFVRRLASLPPEYGDVREGVMAWLESAHRTARQKRDAVESACDLIDLTYKHARELLGTNPGYFSATEALELTEREFAGRAVQDKDTKAEWQLRRRMFAQAGHRLIMEIQNSASRLPRIDASHAPAS